MFKSMVSKSLKGPSAIFTSSFESLQNIIEGSFIVLTKELYFGSTTTENPTTASITVEPFDSALNYILLDMRQERKYELTLLIKCDCV